MFYYESSASCVEMETAVLNSTRNCSSVFDKVRMNPDYQKRIVFSCLISVYLSSIVIAIGLIGNILSFLTFGRDLPTTTSFLLRSLAVADSIVLALGSFTNVYQGADVCFLLQETGQSAPLVHSRPYVFSLIRTAQTISNWIVVTVTFDRYLKICHLAQSRKYCSIASFQKAIAVLVTICTIIHIPVLFEFKTTYETDPCTGDKFLSYGQSEICKNTLYRIGYTIIFQFTIRFLIPLILLTYFNTRLIIEIRRAMKVHRRILFHTISQPKHENSLTLLLIVVVSVFLVCQVPYLVTVVIQGLRNDPEFKSKFPRWIYGVIVTFTNFFLLINCACNFFIYVLVGSRFRSVLGVMCPCGRKRNDILPVDDIKRVSSTRL